MYATAAAATLCGRSAAAACFLDHFGGLLTFKQHHSAFTDELAYPCARKEQVETTTKLWCG